MKFTITIDFNGRSFDVWSQKKDNLSEGDKVLYESTYSLIKSAVKNINPKSEKSKPSCQGQLKTD